MNEYCIRTNKEDGIVGICLGEECHHLNAFIDIWVDDDVTNSPLKTIEDAKLLADVIVKLLKVVT